MSYFSKKKWYSLGILASASLLLAACGSGSNDTPNTGTDVSNNNSEMSSEGDAASSEKVSIEFWSFWGGGSRRDVIEEIIEDFNGSHDNIEVEYVYQPWGDIWTKSLAAVAGGNPPDVVVQDINSVRQRADAEQNTNLKDYLSEEDLSSNFYPQLWDTVEYEGDPYALPFNTDTQVLFYNKDLLEEAGFDGPPETWADLEEYARKLDIKNGDNFERIGYYPLWNIGADVWMLNADKGVSWFDEEENVTINTPEKVEALKWIVDWQEYYGRNTIQNHEAEFGSGVADPFISGLVAMRGQNINYYANLAENAPEDFNFGVAQLPEKEKGSGHYSWGGGFVLEIPHGAKHPEESYEFMKYLTSTEIQEKFGLNSFDIMANMEANENLINHPDLNEKGHMIYEMAHKNLDVTTLTPVPITAPDFHSLVNSPIDEVLLGNRSPEEALEAAQKSVENLVKQHQ